MYKPLELFIGVRYLRAKRRNQFISFISVVSMLGIVLGVTALITVLSVMNGFVNELRVRILSMASHVTVSEYEQTVSNWPAVAKDIEKNFTNVVGLAPYIRSEGMLTSGKQVNGAFIRGVDPTLEPEVSEVGNLMLIGRLSDLESGSYNILLGVGLARTLGVSTGDKVTMVTPQAMSTPAGILPRLKRFTVSGIFEVGHNDYDTAMSFIHIDDAAKLLRMGDTVSGIRIKLHDLFSAPQARYDIAEHLGGNYWVNDWTRQHANFFRAVQIEKRMMSLILGLIVIVAAFNILSALVMVVTDKQSDIAILRTLGIRPSSVMAIFIVQGAIIGFIGTILGLVGGIALALNVDTVINFIEQLFGLNFMPPDVYYISDFPSEIHWSDVSFIACASFLISLLATIYPSWNASRAQPAEALRYE
jgi:lipoprotein-releasing system permease protein